MIAVSMNVGGGPPYQTGKTVHVHAKHNIHRGNLPDMVLYPGMVASLNKHNWYKQLSLFIVFLLMNFQRQNSRVASPVSAPIHLNTAYKRYLAVVDLQ